MSAQGNNTCILAVLLLAAGLSAQSCSNVLSTMEDPNKYFAISKLKKGELEEGRYINKYYRCRLEIPSDFSAKTGAGRSLVKLVYKDEISEIRLYAAKEGGDDISQIYDYFQKMDDSRIERKTKTTIGGVKGDLKVFKYREGKDTFFAHLYMLSSEDNDYVLTLATIKVLYEENLDKLERVVRSFRIIDSFENLESPARSPEKRTPSRVPKKTPTKKSVKKSPPPEKPVVVASSVVTPPPEEEIEGYLIHSVKSGESLSSIAEHYTGDMENWRHIAKINNITDPSKLEVGTELKIPPGGIVTDAEMIGMQEVLHERVGVKNGEAEKVADGATTRVSTEFESLEVLTDSDDTRPPLPFDRKDIEKIESRMLQSGIAVVWDAVTHTVETKGLSVSMRSDETHFLMTEDREQEGYSFRYTVKLDSVSDEITRVKVLCTLKKIEKQGDDMEYRDVRGKKVWALEGDFYDSVGTSLQMEKN